MQHDSDVVHVPYALTRAEEDALLARYGAWDVVHDEAALQQYTAAAPSQFVSDYGDTDVFLTHAAADDSDDDEDRSTRGHTPAGCKDDDSDNDDDDDDGVDEATRRALLSTLPLESLLVQQSTMLGADTPPSLLACVGDVLAQRRSASQAKGTAAAAATTVCEGDVNGTDDSDQDGTTTADDNVQHSADDEDERLVRRAEALLAKADCHADNVCGNNNGSSDDDGGGGDDDECAPEKTSERAVAAHNLVDDSDDSDESDDTTSLLCEARTHIARWAPLQERMAAVMAAAAEDDEEDDDEDVGEEDEDAHDDEQATRARDMHVDVDATATRSLATPRTHEHVSDNTTLTTTTATAHEQQQQQPLLLPVLFAFESAPTRAEEALLHAFDEAARRCSDVCTQRAHAHVTSNSSNNNSNNAGDDDDDKHDEQQSLLHRLQRQAEARTRATAAALRALYADPCADVSVTDDTAAGDAATSSAPPLPLVDEVAVQMRDARVQARAERRYTRVHGALTRRRREVRQLWHRRADVGLAPLRTAVECVDTLLPPPAQEMRLRQQRTAAEATASEQADDDGDVVSSSHVPAIAPSSSSSQPPPLQQQLSPSSPSSLPAHGDDFCAATHNNNNNSDDDGDTPTQRIVRCALRERFRLCMERREAGALRREDAYAVSCARAREAQSRLLQTRLREAAAACARDGDAAYAVLCVCEAKERAALMRAANESAQRAWCSAVRGVCEAHACGVTALTADEAAARVRLHDSERAARVPALRRAYSRYAAAQRRRVRATCAQATACASPVSSSSLPLPLHDEAADKDANRRGALLRLRALVDEQRQHAAWLRHGGGARRWLRAALDAANDERERTRHADWTTTTRAASTRDNVNDDGEQRLVDAVFAHIDDKDDDDDNKTAAATARLDTARLWQHPLLQLLRRAVHASRDGDGEVCSSSALRRVLPLYARVLSFALDGLDAVGDEGDGGATHTRARAVAALTHELDLGGNALTSLHTGALHRAFPALRRLRVNDNAIAHIHCDDGSSGSSSSSPSLSASSSPLLTRPRSVAAARVNARAERVHIADVDVSSNRLCRLDDVAAWLSHSLRQLRAGHNRITSATPLALCRRLAVVDVSRNALRRLDDAVATLLLLRELNVCNNQLTRLYNSGNDDDNNNDDNDRRNKRRSSSSTAMACALPPLLQTLYVSDNPLTTLQLCAPPPPSSSSPSSLLQPRLFVLTQLFANHAQLHELHADAMRCMPLLTVLHLEGNALCDVRALRCCTRLCVLNVSHNRLATRASLCAALATCRTLVELRLRGNPLLLQSTSTASLLRRLTRTLPCLREVDGEAVVQRHSNGHASAAATAAAAAVMCEPRVWRSVCAPSLLPSRVYAAAAAAVAHDMCLHDVRTRLDVHAIALSRDVRVAEAAAATTTAITATATTTSSTQHEDDDSNKHVVRRGEGAVLLASAAALHRSRVWSDGEAALLRVAADAVDTIVRYNSSDSDSIEHMYCNAHVCNDVYAQRARAHAQRAARQRIAAWLRSCVLRRRAQRVLYALRAAADAARLARYTAAARRIQPVWRGALLRARLRRLLYNTKAMTSGNDDEDDDAAFVKVSDADLFGDGDAALAGVTGHSGNGVDVDSDGLRPLLRRVMATRAALPSFAVDMTSSTTTNNNSNNNNDNSNKCSSHTAHDALTPSAQTTSDGAHNDHDVSSGSNDGDEDNESRSSGGGGGAGAGVDEAWRALHGAALAARLAKQKRRMARVHTQHVREAFASDPLRAKKLMTLADTSRHNKNNNNNNSNSSKKQQHK